jgi:hypothetical protein
VQREAAGFVFKEQIEKFSGFLEHMQRYLNPRERFLSPFLRAANLIA